MSEKSHFGAQCTVLVDALSRLSGGSWMQVFIVQSINSKEQEQFN